MIKSLNLQSAVDRYAKALTVPDRLVRIHPRTVGNPGDHGALAPAVTLTAISAFEGFAEEFLAIALLLRGYGFGQTSKKITSNNPTLETWRKSIEREFPLLQGKFSAGWDLQIWTPSATGAWRKARRSWDNAEADAAAWMEVRHCLSHGLAVGWRPEVWPGPLRGDSSAARVLRPRSNDKFSLTINGAITCARVYRHGAEWISTLVASEMATTLNWAKVPDFPLGSKPEEGRTSA